VTVGDPALVRLGDRCSIASSKALDRVAKLRTYAREGVSYVWLVNPRTQTLEILRLEHAQWVVVATHDGDVSVRAEPFPSPILTVPL
jgi:Uma2 family endonuclease